MVIVRPMPTVRAALGQLGDSGDEPPFRSPRAAARAVNAGPGCGAPPSRAGTTRDFAASVVVDSP